MPALKAVVLAGPDPAVDGVVRWRIVVLCRLGRGALGVGYSETGMLSCVRQVQQIGHGEG